MVDAFREVMESRNWETYFHECDETHTYPEEWVNAICEVGFDRITICLLYTSDAADDSTEV